MALRKRPNQLNVSKKAIMTKPTPIERAEILAQFAAVDASFRLAGFEKTTCGQVITEAVASGELTTDEAIAKVIFVAKRGAG